jgi:hypothetical protein
VARMGTLRACIGFGHVLALLRLSVLGIGGAVIDVSFGIDPNLSRPTGRNLRHGCGC